MQLKQTEEKVKKFFFNVEMVAMGYSRCGTASNSYCGIPNVAFQSGWFRISKRNS